MFSGTTIISRHLADQLRMHRAITHLSFADWVCFIFDHPAEGPQWYAAADAPFWNGPAALTAEYVSRLFEEPWPTLEGCSDAELNMALNYLISPGLGEHMLCLDDPSVPLAENRQTGNI